jgi:hypothetical protein
MSNYNDAVNTDPSLYPSKFIQNSSLMDRSNVRQSQRNQVRGNTILNAGQTKSPLSLGSVLVQRAKMGNKKSKASQEILEESIINRNSQETKPHYNLAESLTSETNRKHLTRTTNYEQHSEAVELESERPQPHRKFKVKMIEGVDGMRDVLRVNLAQTKKVEMAQKVKPVPQK